MEMLKKLIFASFALIHILVHVQAQSGFISLDCGSNKDTNYTEPHTQINYISDANYIETGRTFSIDESIKSNHQKQVWNLRSFPDGTRNCYSLNLTKGDRYLIRASFLYGNYDKKNQTPEFDVHLGPNFWTTVKMKDNSHSSTPEIIHDLASDYLDVCLINKGLGTPFMSALELRLLPTDIYKYVETGALQMLERDDFGSQATTTIRYNEDVYDRWWTANFNQYGLEQETVLDSLTLNWGADTYKPPLNAMRNAATPYNVSHPLTITWSDSEANAIYYIYMYFAELQLLQANETREFKLMFNDDSWLEDPLKPKYLTVTDVWSTSGLESTDGKFKIDIIRTENSTLPPILNAFEMYKVIKFPQLQTDKTDIAAIKNIKVAYSLKRNWQGDPCAPRDYLWEGLNCSYPDNDFPRITYLNLSSSGLKEEIPHYIFNLTSLEVLDLSNNNITGSVPDFLGNLSSLKILNLEDNKLSGSVPAILLEKQTAGSLKLSVEGNRDLCKSLTCKKKSSVVIPVVASVASVFVLIVAVMVILWMCRKRGTGETDSTSNMMYGSFEKKGQKFTYSDIVRITRNFERVVGKGGFGSVFHGYLDDAQVAVKMLSSLSSQGYKQFEAEVNLLLRVHHKNLTTLVGYCFDGTNMGLIYEFMGNGDLAEHFSARVSNLNWEIRLRIALEAALGLEYLHSGCKPPIIHRDVKCTNILLDDKFHAKLADFGLSRSFPKETGTDHLSTMVVGTPGYLDPEYYISNRLTEKSDVYSFGVVMMEITTCRPVISQNHNHKKFHISEYVSSFLSKGDIRNLVDPRLEGDVDVNTVWKVLELAMACVSPVGSKRPTMNEIVSELSDCLETEKARRNGVHHHNIEELTLNLEEEASTPIAR